jgi:hypothetical protein
MTTRMVRATATSAFELAAAFDDPLVTPAEEGVGPGRRGGDLAEDAH